MGPIFTRSVLQSSFHMAKHTSTNTCSVFMPQNFPGKVYGQVPSYLGNPATRTTAVSNLLSPKCHPTSCQTLEAGLFPASSCRKYFFLSFFFLKIFFFMSKMPGDGTDELTWFISFLSGPLTVPRKSGPCMKITIPFQTTGKIGNGEGITP